MSDLPAAEPVAAVIARALPRPVKAPLDLLNAPILSTLLRLAIPNTVAMAATTLVVIAETTYVGRLGVEPLAGIALVFPFVVMMAMMSAGAMGGGVSSAISRAFGAGDAQRAAALAFHAAIIGLGGGLVFTLVMETLGHQFFVLLGGRGRVLDEASAYSTVLFTGAISVWLSNTLASIIRGTGNMKIPSATLLLAAALQIVIGGTFGLGLFGFPQFGMRGVASGQVVAFTVGTVFLAWYLLSGRSRITLDPAAFKFRREMFVDILKVGALACLSPVQSVATVLIFTKLLAPYGTTVLAGYGIGSRLEFLLVPIASAIGIASTPIVGMNIGAANIDRARRAAWTAGGLSALLIGTIGAVLSIWPDLWAANFSDHPEVLAVARQYLHLAGPAFAFLGLALALYFASQGSGRILGPVLAQTGRLVTVVLGGWLLLVLQAPSWSLFVLAAASMVVYGALAVLSVWITPWGDRRLVNQPIRLERRRNAL